MFKRGGKYYAWNPVSGRRESTRRSDKQAAISVVAEWERRASDPSYHDAASKTLAHGAEVLMATLRREDAAAGTIEMYEQKIAQLGRLLGDTSPLQSLMQSEKVDQYISTREEEGVTASTIHKELVALRQILKQAKRRKWVRGEMDEVMPVGFSPKYVPKKTFIPVEDWPRLLDAVAVVERSQAKRKMPPMCVTLSRARAAHLAFALATGANDNECKRARRRHIDLEKGFVFIDGTKRASRQRHVPITNLTKPMIERVLRDAPGKDLMFASWGNMWRDLGRRCAALGLPRLTSNDLRRSFGSMLARIGVPFEVIAKLMGHKSTKMVMEVYGQMRPQDLADIVNQLVSKNWDAGGTHNKAQRVSAGTKRKAASGKTRGKQ
jgi:integrase